MATRKTGSNAIGSPELSTGSEDGVIGDGRSDSTIDSLGGIPLADPASFGDGDGSGDNASNNGVSGEPAKRGRGRPKGGGSASRGTTQKDKAVSVTGIEKLLLSVHNILAKATKIEEMKLDNDEAKMIAEAMANVQQHYNMVVDPKYMAWMGLIGVCVTIYGPRAALLVMSKKKGGAQKSAPDNVTPMHRPVEVPVFDPNSFGSKNGGV